MMAGRALTSEPAISSGTSSECCAGIVARPTVIGRSSGVWRKSRPTRRSSQIWMNWRTAMVAIAGSASGSMIWKKMRP